MDTIDTCCYYPTYTSNTSVFLVGMTYANCSQFTAEKNKTGKTTRCDEVRLSLLDSVTKTE